MSTDLRERLRDLADDAPRDAVVAGDVWRRGVRRRRLRRAGAVVLTAVAVIGVLGAGSWLPWVTPTLPPPPAGPAETRGIPELVAPPDPWAEPTRTPGALSAISIAARSTPQGLTDHQSQWALFGVSATDGISRFLDVPARPRSLDPGFAALSPDGTLLAYTRTAPRRQPGARRRGVEVRGWDVLDTTTGEVRELRVPGQEALPGAGTYEISFSGDGRYLLTNFSLTGSNGDKDDSLVVWDVATGEHTVAEGPGHYWLPGPATAPTAVAWNRWRSVLTFDPATGVRDRVVLPHQVVEASWSPDRQTLAYIGHRGDSPTTRAPWRLHVDTAGAGAEPRRLDVGISPGQILGWTDDTHVVVSRYGPREARVVDTESGEWEPLDLAQADDALMVPRYATARFAEGTVDPVDQPVVGDPRLWMHTWFRVAVAGGLLLVALLLVRARRGRRGLA